MWRIAPLRKLGSPSTARPRPKFSARPIIASVSGLHSQNANRRNTNGNLCDVTDFCRRQHRAKHASNRQQHSAWGILAGLVRKKPSGFFWSRAEEAISTASRTEVPFLLALKLDERETRWVARHRRWLNEVVSRGISVEWGRPFVAIELSSERQQGGSMNEHYANQQQLQFP